MLINTCVTPSSRYRSTRSISSGIWRTISVFKESSGSSSRSRRHRPAAPRAIRLAAACRQNSSSRYHAPLPCQWLEVGSRAASCIVVLLELELREQGDSLLQEPVDPTEQRAPSRIWIASLCAATGLAQGIVVHDLDVISHASTVAARDAGKSSQRKIGQVPKVSLRWICSRCVQSQAFRVLLIVGIGALDQHRPIAFHRSSATITGACPRAPDLMASKYRHCVAGVVGGHTASLRS